MERRSPGDWGYDWYGNSYGSNYGLGLDLVAPGNNIISTLGSSYGKLSGTSMACPHVVGVISLYISETDIFSPGVIEAALFSTAKDLGISEKDIYYGYGLVNAY